MIFDTQSWQDGRYRIFSQGYIAIPYGILSTATNTGAVSPLPQPLSVAFKQAGFMSAVNQVNVQINTKGLTQNSVNQALVENFNLITQTSVDQLAKLSSVMGFMPDTPDSDVTAVVAATSINTRNNVLDEPNTYLNLSNGPSHCNRGMLSRARFIAPNAYSVFPTAGSQTSLAGAASWNVATATTSTNYGANPGMNYCSQTLGASGAASYSAWSGYLIIPLANLCPLFASLTMPLKNVRFYIQVQLNAGAVTIVATASTNATTATGGHTSGNLVPFMLSDNFTALANTVPSGIKTTTVSIAYGQYTSILGSGTFAVSSANPCRMYAPIVAMTAEQEKAFVYPNGKSWQRVISYTDHFYFSLPNQAQGQVNWNPINGVPNLRKLIVWLTPSSATNTVTNPANTTAFTTANALVSVPYAAAGVDPADSFIQTQPFTGMPWAYLANQQMQINGTPLNPTPYNFDGYEQFLAQGLRQTLGANRFTEPLCSGLWNSYGMSLGTNRYYFWDCQANPELAKSNLPCNINLVATLTTPGSISATLNMLVIYERGIEIDMGTGATQTLSDQPIVHYS